MKRIEKQLAEALRVSLVAPWTQDEREARALLIEFDRDGGWKQRPKRGWTVSEVEIGTEYDATMTFGLEVGHWKREGKRLWWVPKRDDCWWREEFVLAIRPRPELWSRKEET